MAKYYGEIGFATSEEIRPGVWQEKIVKKNYCGDSTRRSRYSNEGDKVIDDMRIGVDISIVADAMAYQYFSTIRYATYGGAKWEVTSIDIQRPRLNLVLGGLYHGDD